MREKLLLASQSPRRVALLKSIQIMFDQKVVDIDETPRQSELPEPYLERIVLDKFQAAFERYGQDYELILTADTAVICDHTIMGKPQDQIEAMTYLKMLSNRTHEVKTAICINKTIKIVTSQVDFREITEPEMEAYWQSGEAQGKAGAYGIQGIAAIFVKAIRGSYSNIVGLPIFETAQMLEDFGVKVL